MSAQDHEAHGLTAGYAVHALSREERQRAEQHLRECADCCRDLRDFEETMVLLAHGVAEEPPERVWDALRAEAAGTRQSPPLPVEGGAEAAPGRGGASTPLRGRGNRLPWLVAAASLVVALALTGVSAAGWVRMSALEARTAEVEALLAASDTRMSEAAVPGSPAQATVFASDSHDMVMIVVKGLPAAPDGKAYQLWYIDGDGTTRSAGMLAPSGDGRMLTATAPGLNGARQLGITMEPADGMPQPSEEPMKVDV